MSDDRRDADHRTRLELMVSNIDARMGRLETALLGVEGLPETSFIHRTDTAISELKPRVKKLEDFKNKLSAAYGLAVLASNAVLYKWLKH